MRKVRPEELPQLLAQGVKVVDVRPQDRRESPLPFPAEWVPLEKIQKGEHGLPRVPLLLVCEKGLLSQVAALYLEAEGYEAMSLEGGLQQGFTQNSFLALP
ncbi:sulfurtransferase [Thermus composti]|uniref:Rhodanese-like domain-containing protein n=1 Tax=Thermus composti TaxID=532059 RepID=A0ABV6PZE9_9DEIN|nr:rhodanese-like domain-containing protein [Thermus composti]GGM92199.1 sulfurtransferase [Thermus composti]